MARYNAEIEKGLKKYSHKDLAKRDISYLTSLYKDLIPHVDNFVFNNGISQPLLSLTGTIPVTYKGNTYNIPIALWLQESHPYNPPMVYVKPTSTMQIKEGPHVDSAGRVFLPCLTEWKHPHSDLLSLVQILTVIFSEDCPVFSVANIQSGRSSAGSMPYSNSRSPYPGGAGNYSVGMPMPRMPTPGSYTSPSQRMQYPQQAYTCPSYTNQPSFNSNPYQQRQPYPGSSAYPPYPAASFAGSSQPSYPMQSQAGIQQSHQPQTTQPSLTEEQIKASLVSAVRDKMTRKLEDAYGQAYAEVQSLQKTQDDLNKGKIQLEDMLMKLENEQKEVDRNIDLLKHKDAELDEMIQKMETQNSDFDVDSAIAPPAPLYRQILNSFAEEQALEDAMYYLGDALRKGVIDIDVFLKNIREISRRQFMLRALINKCRQKAGLPELT